MAARSRGCACERQASIDCHHQREVPTVSSVNVIDGQYDTKATNPKDIIGQRKIDLGLVPDSAIMGLAHALTEGAIKYGRYNWRIAGVRASVYNAAAKRHHAKWWNGQDMDTATRVHHLDNEMAC